MSVLVKDHLNELVRNKKISTKEMSEIMLTISDPWEQARGLLKHKKISAVAYQKKLRKEWDR